MCGIFFSLSASEHVLPQEKTATWLRNRGPDNYYAHLLKLESPRGAEVSTAPDTIYLTFISSVLALRGNHITSQPLVDTDSNYVLCWNGEAWKINGELVDGNDTELVFQKFIEVLRYRHDAGESETSRLNDSVARLTNIISNITGPFSFVFYDGVHRRLYFSRDCLGRRSLLHGQDDSGNLRICSVCDGSPGAAFEEVETDGLHMIDLSRISLSKDTPDGTPRISYQVEVIPWSYESVDAPLLRTPLAPMNRTLPSTDPPSLSLSSSCVQILEHELRRSVEIRVRNIPQLGCGSPGADAKVAVLFSGGLDCTLLARLAHDALPKHESIDLINVAFENPRVAAALKAKHEKENGKEQMPSIYESCPDRITGRAGHAELQKVCPDRVWRFVAVNIPFQEFTAHREEVIQLMRPHNTEMDLSIACALYFASRGQGIVATDDSSDATTTYTTTARVLLSGLGADELFAGYGRHGIAFARKGFEGLIDEIDLDVSRLGKRNLGRDDRAISNWGREARFPFLDEEFVSWATQTPVWERCGFGTAKAEPVPDDELDRIAESLDFEKKALRLLALKLGMVQTAQEKKRAIQFGSRTAKMESGRSKGTQTI
jgi:asparagine synthetase B (glutamine-hydrolysing)